MEEEIKIMDAVPEDALGITTVLHKTWLSTYPNEDVGITVEDIEESYKDAYRNENIKNQERKIAELPSNKKKIVAKQNNIVIGTAMLVKNEENNELVTMYVLPEFQHKGIGVALWKELDEFRDKTKDTIVHVANYNEQAIHFYKRIGFVDTGKRITDERWRMKNGSLIPEMEMVIEAK